ncbi:hypothetical protein JOQ06_026988 [Pogonophryne albipinna]|uniref:Arf-GAP domain-containing protein n=1 Tax=Pogonophryne albipinna TaxID=1090488 RepID=A0AAD6BC30_9TELE|nr:hypothetical protein JOQ06_026988 [Pogonophryne albipinna]
MYREPEWASLTLGVFVCQACSLLHRSIPHISRVKSVQETWDASEVELVASTGNNAAKAKYEQKVPAFYYRPIHSDCKMLREQWIRAKYERKEFEFIEKQEPYSAGYREGFLWKRGRDNGQFLSRKFILSEREGALKYFNKQDARDPKAMMKIETLNATFQPAKIGNPCGLQITYLRDNSTRNIFVYHSDAKYQCLQQRQSTQREFVGVLALRQRLLRMEASVEKGKNGHLNPAFHLKVVGPINKASSHKGLPHTSKEVLPLRPGPVSNGTQPVNIVRPLRPSQSPMGGSRDVKVVRPPLPASKPPTAPPKSPATPQRLSPPKKPLPLNPTRSPLLVSELQPRQSPFPPQRPLPLSPARGASPTVSPARTPLPKPSTGLLVMMPPAVGPKPVGKVTAIPPLRALSLVTA